MRNAFIKSAGLFLSSLALIQTVISREIAPATAEDWAYKGIQSIYGSHRVPKLYFGAQSYYTSCGWIDDAAYCQRDHAIFITTKTIQRSYKFGDSALSYIIAHEYAHALQPNPGHPFAELEADCLAGFYLDAIPNVVFDERDVIEMASITYQTGDFSRHTPHGTPEQRTNQLLKGIAASQQYGTQGIQLCYYQ